MKSSFRVFGFPLLLVLFNQITLADNPISPENLMEQARTAYHQRLQYDSARMLYDQALSIYQKRLDTDNQAKVLYNISQTYYIQSNYTEALKKSLEAKSKMSSTTPCKLKLNNDLAIGRIKYAMKNKDEALQYVYELLPEIEQCNLPSLRSLALNYIAVVNFELGNIDTAEVYFKKHLAMCRELGDTAAMSQTHAIFGELYLWHKKYYSRAKLHIDTAIMYANCFNDINAKAFAHIKMAMYFIEVDEPQKSFVHLDTAEAQFRQMQSLVDIVYVRHNRADAHRKLGNTDSVHLIWQGIYAIHDTIYDRDKRKDVVRFEKQFETQEKEKENLLLVIENEERARENRNLILISIFALLTLIIFGIWRYGKLRAKQLSEKAALQQKNFKAIVEAEEKERVRIAKDLHDGLGQILSTAKLNIASIEESIIPEDKKLYNNSITLVDQAVQEVRNVSHDLMPGVLIELGLVSAIEQLIDKMNDSQLLSVSFECNMHDDRLSSSTEIALYRVVQEVLNNMIKHANAKHIYVTLQKHKEHVKLILTDDGKGFDTRIIQTSKGIGWRNIFSRIEMLNGSVQLTSEKGKGTEVSVILSQE